MWSAGLFTTSLVRCIISSILCPEIAFSHAARSVVTPNNDIYAVQEYIIMYYAASVL